MNNVGYIKFKTRLTGSTHRGFRTGSKEGELEGGDWGDWQPMPARASLLLCRETLEKNRQHNTTIKINYNYSVMTEINLVWDS